MRVYDRDDAFHHGDCMGGCVIVESVQINGR